MTTEAAEFNEREFLEVATRYAREIHRSEDPQDILKRYALDYTEDPAETVSTVIWLLREQNREYSQGAIEEFLRTNAETRAASLSAKVAPASFASEAQSGELTGESKPPSKSSFPPGWSAGKIINYLRSRGQFLELEGCRELLQDPSFLRSVRMVPPQHISAHLLARLLNLTPTNVDGIEKGTIPVSLEICDSLFVIFEFHEQAADEFRSRAGIEKAARTPRDSTTVATPEAEQTLFSTALFGQMRDSLRDLLVTNGPVYMGDGVTELWPTQRELLEQCLAFLDTAVGEQVPGVEEEQIKRGQFMEALSATGSGKTDSFGRLATAMNQGIRVPVLILTPRRLLNAQTKERFRRMHGVDERDIMIWDSNQPVRERIRLFQQNPPPTYLIASYQSLFNLISEHQLDFTTPGSRHCRPLVILDEVPEAIGSERGNLIRETFIDKVLVAGFAAADAGAAAALFRGQAPIYNLDIAEGIKRKVLCQKVETLIIDVPLDDDLESAAMLARMRAVRGDEEYDPLDTSAFARSRRVINAAVDFHLSYYREDAGYVRERPTVFFIDGINAAAQGARIFNERARALGLAERAGYVSGEESLFIDYDAQGNITRMTKNPDEILRMLDSGEIQAVWNDRMVGIGTDLPNLANCYHVGHSHSLYRLLQELGRITRKGDGNKTALAVNVCASGTDPYLYEDVLGSSEVESRERQEREERRVSRSPSGGTRREDIPYMQVPNSRVYASRADRQAESPTRETQPGVSQLRVGRPEISARERDTADAIERSMAEERRRVIRDVEEQLRERAASVARADIFATTKIADFVKLLPDYTGSSLRQLGIKIGKEKYLDKLARGESAGSRSRDIILPFLRQHYPQLAKHFDHITKHFDDIASVSLPVTRLMATENSADFLRILRAAHPLPIRQRFYGAVQTDKDNYTLLAQGRHIPSVRTIALFRLYLRQQTGSDALYEHLVTIRNEQVAIKNDEARRKAAVSLSPDVLLATKNRPEFLTLLRDAHPPKIGGGRERLYSILVMSKSYYRDAALGASVLTEDVTARFQPYLRQITGSDDAYQHLLRLPNEPLKTITRRPDNSADISKASRAALAKQFLDAWSNNKEQVAEDKRSGVLMLKLREANGMSQKELADHFQSRGIRCDGSKILFWEKRGFPRDNAEAVVEEYAALASALGKQASEGRSPAGLSEQVRECLTLEAERRKQKRRKKPGETMGALVAVPALVAAALLGHGTAPPSQGQPPAIAKLSDALSPMEQRHPADLLSVYNPEALHDLPKQDKQKDIRRHLEEIGLKGFGKNLLGKIRRLGQRQRA